MITSSHDSTIRLWDLATGKSYCTLTHHKVRLQKVDTLLYSFSEKCPSVGSASSSPHVCLGFSGQHQAVEGVWFVCRGVVIVLDFENMIEFAVPER